MGCASGWRNQLSDGSPHQGVDEGGNRTPADASRRPGGHRNSTEQPLKPVVGPQAVQLRPGAINTLTVQQLASFVPTKFSVGQESTDRARVKSFKENPVNGTVKRARKGLEISTEGRGRLPLGMARHLPAKMVFQEDVDQLLRHAVGGEVGRRLVCTGNPRADANRTRLFEALAAHLFKRL